MCATHDLTTQHSVIMFKQIMRSNSAIPFNTLYIHCLLISSNPQENKLMGSFEMHWQCGSVGGNTRATVHLFNTLVYIKISGQFLDGLIFNLADT